MTVVHVPQNEAAPVIRQLLAAAEQLGLPASVVATSSDGTFGFSLIVPDEVHAKAFPALYAEAKTQLEDPEPEPEPAPKKKGGRPRKVVAEPVVEEAE